MIQLNFSAPTAEAALASGDHPYEVGYSQHTGGEKADWGDSKLQIVGGTHPVVYPAAGSHANFFGSALYLGSSGEQGVGCDDTRNADLQLTPHVDTIPSDTTEAQARFPWIAFEGYWGERQPAFFNGPTGPNMKTQWTHPITWSHDWRSRAYAVPAGGVLGTDTTDFFCGADAQRIAAAVDRDQPPGRHRADAAGGAGGADLALKRATWTPAGADPRRPPPRLGAGALGVGPHVSQPSAVIHRDRAAPDPGLDRDHRAAGAGVRGVVGRRRRGRGRVGRPAGVRAAGDRHRPHVAWTGHGAGGDGPGDGRDRQRPAGGAGRRLPAGAGLAAAAAGSCGPGGGGGLGAADPAGPVAGRDLAGRPLGADRPHRRAGGSARASRRSGEAGGWPAAAGSRSGR